MLLKGDAMAIFNQRDMPSEVIPLFASAEAGEINPKEFCQALKGMGIDGVPAMFYLSKAFSLPWEAAKKVVIEEAYGTVEAWADPIIENISEIDREED